MLQNPLTPISLIIFTLLVIALLLGWVDVDLLGIIAKIIDVLLKLVSWSKRAWSANKPKSASDRRKDSFAYQFRLRCKNSDKLLRGVKVILETIDRAPQEEATDNEGLVRFFQSESCDGQPARLIIMSGTERYVLHIDLIDGTLPRQIHLDCCQR